jgi:hypothetical protein
MTGESASDDEKQEREKGPFPNRFKEKVQEEGYKLM